MGTPILEQFGAVLIKMETVFNTAVVPQPSDAILIESASFEPDITQLTRNFVRPSLSPVKNQQGRKIGKMKFTCEIKGNGVSQLGVIEPTLGRLLRTCGFSETAMTTVGSCPDGVIPVDVPANPITWGAVTGTDTGTGETSFFLTVATPGVSGTATIQVTSDDPSFAPPAPLVVTSGTAFLIGDGNSVVPTFAGALVAGDSWVVSISGRGWMYRPRSTLFESATIYMYLGGKLHTMSGCRGTFDIAATAGDIGKINFEIWGQYIPETDVLVPVVTYDGVLVPPKVELARLILGAGYKPFVSAFTYTHANTLTPRVDQNSTDGYNGILITGRAPTGGIDPEATLVADNDFWGQLSDAKAIPFQQRCGTVVGNTVWFKAPSVQYTKLTYNARDGIRTYDAGLQFNGQVGDDEFRIIFG